MKANSWSMVKLGDYVELLTGFPFKSAQYTDDPIGIRLLRGDNIAQGTLRWDGVKRWATSDVEQFSKYSLELDDVILAMDRPWIEAGLKWAFIKKTDLPCLLVQRVARLRGKNGLLTRFLRYVIADYHFTGYVKGVLTGVNIPHVSGSQIQAYQFCLPPIKAQEKIADTLSAYDRLIENNTRRIKILEEMVQTLYREWFVNFRFPGHEKTKLVDSELGLIPEGWEVKILGDVCNIIMGQSPKSEFYNESGEGLPFHQGVTNFGDRFPTDKTYCTVLNRIAKTGDILFSVRAPVGRINIANKRIIIGRGLCAIRSKSENQAFILQQLKDKFQEEDSMGGGTIFKSVTKEDMYGIKTVAPHSLLLKRFEELVQPIFRNLEILTITNINLRKTRDLLLPKLISGEIDVENLDIETEVTAA